MEVLVKIGDVKIGEEYAVLDSPTVRSQYAQDKYLPRRVRALEVKPVEVSVPHAFQTTERVRTVKKLRVLVLDDRLDAESSWKGNEIHTAAKGDELLIYARQAIGPWSEIREDVAAKINQRGAKQKLYDATRARLEALGLDGGVQTPGMGRLSINLHDEDVERILSLAEKGAAS